MSNLGDLVDAEDENNDNSVLGDDEPKSMPKWLYGAAAGGAVLMVGLTTGGYHLVAKKRRNDRDQKMNDAIKADEIEKLAPRGETPSKPKKKEVIV